MAKWDIKTLQGKTDDELQTLLGFKSKIECFREDLATADKLSGKARETVERRLEEMFTPRPYVEDLKYTIESAERQAKRKTGKGEAAYCGCDIVD